MGPFVLSLSKHERHVSLGRSLFDKLRVSGFSLLAVLIFLLPAFAAEENPSYIQAVTAYNGRDMDGALRHAKEAVGAQPDHVEAQILLGHLYYLRQDLAKAAAHWKKALKLAPGREDLRKLVQKLETETAAEKNLSRSDTHPFVIRYADGQVPPGADSLRDILRDAYRKIGQQFNYFPDNPITVLLYPGADYEKAKGISHQVAGLYDGKIRLPLRNGQMTGDQLRVILWHEYTHALVQDLSLGRCPMWLNEGLATLQESRLRPVDLRLAKAALEEGKLPSWEQLWAQESYEDASLLLSYQTAYLITRYLVKRWSWREMTQLLGRLGQGVSMQAALRVQYKTDPAVLEKEWRAWLRRNL